MKTRTEHDTTYRCFNNVSKSDSSSIDFSKCLATETVICKYKVLVLWYWFTQDGSKTFIGKQTIASFAWKNALIRCQFGHNMFALDGKHTAFLMFVSPLVFMQLGIHNLFPLLQSKLAEHFFKLILCYDC